MPARQASGYCILVPPRPQAHCKHEKYNGRGCQPFFEQVVYPHAFFSPFASHVAVAALAIATWVFLIVHLDHIASVIVNANDGIM